MPLQELPAAARGAAGAVAELPAPIDATSFARAAADPGRLAVLGALATRPRELAELSQITELDPRRRFPPGPRSEASSSRC